MYVYYLTIPILHHGRCYHSQVIDTMQWHYLPPTLSACMLAESHTHQGPGSWHRISPLLSLSCCITTTTPNFPSRTLLMMFLPPQAVHCNISHILTILSDNQLDHFTFNPLLSSVLKSGTNLSTSVIQGKKYLPTYSDDPSAICTLSPPLSTSLGPWLLPETSNFDPINDPTKIQ